MIYLQWNLFLFNLSRSAESSPRMIRPSMSMLRVWSLGLQNARDTAELFWDDANGKFRYLPAVRPGEPKPPALVRAIFTFLYNAH